MSHKYQGDALGDGGEEHKVARSRQPNGEHPVRRSWRPCQMVNQDGEVNPHHHHHHHHHHPHSHPATARGPTRHRQRPPQVQSQGQGSGPVPPSPVGAENRGPELCPVKEPRPAVTRYRRHGDPNPRLRGHRHRQPIRERQDYSSPPTQEEREGPSAVQQCPFDYSVVDQSVDSVGVFTPTYITPAPAASEGNEQLQLDHVSSAQEEKIVQDEESKEGEREDGGCSLTASESTCNHDNLQTAVNDREEMLLEKVEEDQEEAIHVLSENSVTQGSELTDLCSDTESAASLSMDGPLHSPPPLHSPTPPSSPDVPHFPQFDHFSDGPSVSPLPENDLLPPEDNEDCSESCSLSLSTSCSETYPKSYADDCTESHRKSYTKPLCQSFSQPYVKSHPNSFPESLKSSYPDFYDESPRQPGRKPEANETHLESSYRQENVQKGAPSSPAKFSNQASRQSRDRGPHQLPMDRSVGCRLHHYDGHSDSESDGTDQSRVPKIQRHSQRRTETHPKSPTPKQSNSGVAQDEQVGASLSGEECTKGSDAISLAIKDIKEAIEEVKTKTVRSPYTPDQPEEPIWVMRQDVSPTEDIYPHQTSVYSCPHSPSQSGSDSPSRYASLPVQESVSPVRAEVSRDPQQHYPKQSEHGHQSQQRDTARPPHSHVHTPPSQHQQQQHQPPQVQPQSQQPFVQKIRRPLPPFPTFVDVPGPCDPEDLIDGIIFAATYLGCTHLLSERTPTKSARMQQAQEAMNRVRSPDGEAPCTAEVDLFMSTQRIKVLNADTQDSIMDLPLRTISYIADIGNMVVLMARGKMVRSRSAQEQLDQTAEEATMTQDDRRLYRMICHVFESEDAQLIAQSIGQSFSVAYQEFLRANGIDPEDLSQREYSDLLNTQDMYNDDLIHFSKSENCRDVYIEKQKGEIVGVVIVESGWGSIVPTVIIASMMHAGPAEKSGRLNIGDQIMTINGTSLVGLPLNTCQSIIKGLKSQSRIKMNIVRCPPVTMVLIRRPDLRYQLGFSVQNGIICSLMRGGIAERGGVRVGHRIIEINSTSVVATQHEKIVQILSNAMGEIHMKTMPAAMYRLLTAQEQPVYI
ncbi:amyloid-beta A4 precursor protein-binding family A member 1-like isoform X2 [Thalassophryne amazonica]|uniref:amyloid-beta A4 precursor protein-binding family A member 1-like isoform X2 n=1 Tax=Thalassophryne amazonica TaxID=390379 RepID=UPI0014720B42|nr:amyloid-beta A4 precursor protein-binding family A member 1-like isoform X2 [Thalassophryne amazonica]